MESQRSIRNVNLLYLTAFLALLAGSVVMASLSLGWRLVINELLLLGVPLAVYLLLTGGDASNILRVRGVSWAVAGLSLVVGLGLWRFDWWLATTINEALDYTIPLPPEALNVTLLDQILMVLGTVVLAPIIEELLFRGAVQTAYERRGPLIGVVVSSLLFMTIHLELAQSVAILPVAVAMGYAAWRTNSVLPAVLIHFANNGQAMLVSALQEGGVRRVGFTPSPLIGLIGGLVAVAALWLVTRLTRRPGPERPGREPPGREPSSPAQSVWRWLGRIWPLFPVVPIYLFVIAAALVIGVRPEILALGQELELAPAPWEEETRWTYEIRNALEEPVGEAECSVAPDADAFVLECSMEQSGYEADAPTGFFQEGGVSQTQTVRWDRETLTLEDAVIEATAAAGEGEISVAARLEGGGLAVEVDGVEEMEGQFDRCYQLDQQGESENPPAVQDPCQVEDGFLAGGGFFSPLMVGEWPWRFSALPFQLTYSRRVDIVWPYRGVEGVDGRAPARGDGFVVVRTAEQVSTPAGDFVTWRVTVGEKYTAWYTVEAPHHLVAYSDDMVSWRLTGVE